MNQTDKHGQSKIVQKCSLPLTSTACVNMVITDMAVFSVEKNRGLVLHEVFKPHTIDEVLQLTDATVSLHDKIIFS